MKKNVNYTTDTVWPESKVKGAVGATWATFSTCSEWAGAEAKEAVPNKPKKENPSVKS